MNRRNLIAGVGTALAAPLFGRISTPQSTTDTGSDPDPDSDTITSFEPEAVRTELAVGSRAGVEKPESNRPHGVSVWNGTPEAANVELRVVDETAGRTVLELASELSADTAVDVSLLEPSTYRLEVQVPAMDASESIEIERSWFDCNSSSTQVAVFEDGRIESQTISTLVACSDETVSGTPDG